MKKTLIAVAALAATSAFAQVTVTGTVDATFGSTSITNNGAAAVSNVAVGSNGSGTTNVTFKANEDLGGGLSAMGLYEQDFTMTQGAPTSAEVYVGLAGGFGSVKIGTPNSPTLYAQLAQTPFSTKLGGRASISGLSYVGANVTRQAGSVVYASPNFSGATVNLGYTPEAKNAAGVLVAGTITDLSVAYANGPISAIVAVYSQAANATPNTDSSLTSFNVGYDMGVAKITLGGHTYKAGGADMTSGIGLGVSAPLSSALTAQFGYQTRDDKTAGNNDSKMMAVGVNYAMSKRTSTYARYVNETRDNAAAGSFESGNSVFVGLRHNF